MFINGCGQSNNVVAIEISRMSIAYFLSTINIVPKKFETYIPVFLSSAFVHNMKISRNPSDFYQESYQRLEFLGDSLIGSYVSEFLFKKYKDYGEGAYSEIMSELTRNTMLATIGMSIGIDAVIHKGYDESLSKNEKTIADVFEALIGAIYMDLGTRAAKKFVQNFVINPSIEKSVQLYDKRRADLGKVRMKSKEKKAKKIKAISLNL